MIMRKIPLMKGIFLKEISSRLGWTSSRIFILPHSNFGICPGNTWIFYFYIFKILVNCVYTWALFDPFLLLSYDSYLITNNQHNVKVVTQRKKKSILPSAMMKFYCSIDPFWLLTVCNERLDCSQLHSLLYSEQEGSQGLLRTQQTAEGAPQM